MVNRANLDVLVPPISIAASALVFWNIYDTYAITWLWHNNAMAFIDGGCAAVFSRIAYRNLRVAWKATRQNGVAHE
jgi:hypothetical protein